MVTRMEWLYLQEQELGSWGEAGEQLRRKCNFHISQLFFSPTPLSISFILQTSCSAGPTGSSIIHYYIKDFGKINFSTSSFSMYYFFTWKNYMFKKICWLNSYSGFRLDICTCLKNNYYFQMILNLLISLYDSKTFYLLVYKIAWIP